jgi:hypothetical protein
MLNNTITATPNTSDTAKPDYNRVYSQLIRRTWNLPTKASLAFSYTQEDLTLEKSIDVVVDNQNSLNELAQFAILTQKYYIVSKTGVFQFLRLNTYLYKVLIDAHIVLSNIFYHNAKITLKLMTDGENDNHQELIAHIHTELSAEDALEKLDEFDEQWFLDNMELIDDKLTFNVRSL